ncbi:pyridoxal-phosphate dependent enzyme [Ideonella azotifigens]|uniref:Hydroxyectoine utilization dehydratase EutB n=1 Tax=Ideonella azotifigens TaxID=513160 RepID=A0ABN1JKE0_9BURK|nr:pyridoxal-phosphate dependent enzyme [Ideonella azotifigens]MCD2341904.1 pyridoxal-phosphate dependent enzyme [Ideonella azotifigens]
MPHSASSAHPGTESTAHPLLCDIERTARRLAGQVLHTPVWQWQTGAASQLAPQTEVWLKLELFQHTGSFKLRGALNCIQALDAPALTRGVVAASAGNHAVAVAYAARTAGTHALLFMPRHASPVRVAACREQGAEVLLTDTIHQAFAQAQQAATEGLSMIHPFDGPLTAEGTATIGLELMRQVPWLDAVVVPVGGGGLCGGIAAAVKQLNPRTQVFGVEPFGADAMYRSFQANAPQVLARVDTVADSLCAPYALAYSYGVCRRFVDEIVRVNDREMVAAMHHLFRDMKLAVEPASAASTAALLGPLRGALAGKRVALVVCGANIDTARFSELLAEAA